MLHIDFALLPIDSVWDVCNLEDETRDMSGSVPLPDGSLQTFDQIICVSGACIHLDEQKYSLVRIRVSSLANTNAIGDLRKRIDNSIDLSRPKPNSRWIQNTVAEFC